MYDKKKITIMTKLAVYDKNFAEEDLRADQYFRHDYIYKKNMKNRIFVFIGCIIVILLYVLHRIVYGNFDIYAINYTAELIKIILFFAAMLIAYTVLGTAIYTAEFHKAQERLDKYFKLLDRLDKYTATMEKRKKLIDMESGTGYEADGEIDEIDDETDDETTDDENDDTDFHLYDGNSTE